MIIPGVRRYLQTENHPLYEIDVRGFTSARPHHYLGVDMACT